MKKACLQSVLNTGVSLFQGCPLREAPLYMCSSIGKKTYFVLLCISIVSLHSKCDISIGPMIINSNSYSYS